MASTCVPAAPLCREKRCQLIPAATTLLRKCLQAGTPSSPHLQEGDPAPLVLMATFHILALHEIDGVIWSRLCSMLSCAGTVPEREGLWSIYLYRNKLTLQSRGRREQ